MRVWVQVWTHKYGTDIGVFETEEGAIETFGKTIAEYPDDVVCDEAREEFHAAVVNCDWRRVIDIYFEDQDDHCSGESYLIEDRLVYP